MTLAMLDDIVAVGHDRASLDVIAQPDAALAIWWRSLPDALRAALASLDLDAVDDVSLDLAAEVPTGAVGVFKGRLLLDPPTILHRSPPISATGERRLVLAIDPLPSRPIA